MNRNVILALACGVVTVSAFAQSSVSAPSREQILDKAKQDFAAEKWSEAFREFNELHSQYPTDDKISEYLAESAFNTGSTELAISLMEPIRKVSPERWQASALLARAYAESNRDAERDAEIANLKQLHDTKFAPRIAQLQMFLLERRVLPNGSVRIWYRLEPWGKFNTYLFARIYGGQGVEIYHIALDSSDLDQTVWAKTHSKEAAAGERVFFLDGYSPTQKNPDGNLIFTQALLGTFDGKPAYDRIRDQILAIASDRTSPVSTTTSKQPN
ncbi:MAG: hypothetical protein WA254_15545 [Candidatus Sulfotelmatobacter sp.]